MSDTAVFQEYKERVGNCATCGNSPINHTAAYFLYTSAIFLDGLLSRLKSKRSPSQLKVGHPSVMRMQIDTYVYGIALALGILRISNDSNYSRTYRAQVIWEEAERRGIEMQQLTFLGSYTDVYRARIAGKWFYFESIPVPPRLQVSNISWIDDKYALKTVLSSHGIPTPSIRSASKEI